MNENWNWKPSTGYIWNKWPMLKSSMEMLLPIRDICKKAGQKEKTLKFSSLLQTQIFVYLSVSNISVWGTHSRLLSGSLRSYISGRPFPYDFVHFISGQTMTLRVKHIARVKGRCFQMKEIIRTQESECMRE